MNARCLLLLVTLAIAAAAQAQLTAPQRALATVKDPSMVINDRGAQLEVIPDKRAILYPDQAGRLVNHHVISSSTTEPLGSRHLGVVFNHAMQQQGYITGEIAFKMKAGQQFTGEQAQYPGLKKLGTMYVLVARNPREFITLVKQLQQRSDVAWVEPVVTYGPVDKESRTQ
jgi:hypothetical protein